VEHSRNTAADTVYIVRIDGTRFGPYSTEVEPNKALIYEVTLNAGAGDTLERIRADGSVETYLITNTHFQPQMSAVEAHYTVRLRKD
jgi:hypothetical protein